MHPNINHQSKTGFLQKISSSLDDHPKHSDWRDQFNREVFKTTFRDQPLGSVSFRHPEAKKTLPPDLQSLIDNSSTYTIKDVNGIIQCIKLDPKNNDLSSSFAYMPRGPPPNFSSILLTFPLKGNHLKIHQMILPQSPFSNF